VEETTVKLFSTVGFDVLARRPSHFSVEATTKIRETWSGGTLEANRKLMTDGHKSGCIKTLSRIYSKLLLEQSFLI
jgi:hypothetical protein